MTRFQLILLVQSQNVKKKIGRITGCVVVVVVDFGPWV